LPAISRQLDPSGFGVVELGLGQDSSVSAIAAGSGLAMEALAQDLSGIVRAMVLVPAEQ
jgi:release factor glutamine methyltransferase